ncbi:MAG: dihydropteroate synthase [Phycisphaerales bacterium]|nr:MAG: dihydropteroate synthase [Phycisphaerales bacterium]
MSCRLVVSPHSGQRRRASSPDACGTPTRLYPQAGQGRCMSPSSQKMPGPATMNAGRGSIRTRSDRGFRVGPWHAPAIDDVGCSYSEHMQTWRLAHGRSVVLDRPRVMAIVNLTPDSFFAGSRAEGASQALAMARAAVADGADMLDLGAESTRPGAERVPGDEQLRRLIPAIEAIRADADPAVASVPISVDTTLAQVAREAIERGADAINDVSGGTEDEGVLALAAETGAGLCLMHRLAPPRSDRYSTGYDAEPDYGAAGVIGAVRGFLAERARAALAAGVAPGAILLDPGLGFGKSPRQNIELLRATPDLAGPHPELPGLGLFPVLSATSRKSFVAWAQAGGGARAGGGDRPLPGPEGRLAGSLAFSVLHLACGARLFRVHDAAAQGAALRAAWAVLEDVPGDGGGGRPMGTGDG